MNQNTDSKGDRFMPVIYLSIVILVVISIVAYCLDIPEILFKLTDETGKVQPNNVNGEFFKFLFLILGGLIALLGLWINNKRLDITNKQIELQTEQVKIAIDNQKNVEKQIQIAEQGQLNIQKQIQLAEKTQINTRFKDAAQLLASEHISAILSGIYALDQIAVEVSRSDDEQYKGYVKVVHDILCAYLRENSVLDDLNEPIERNRPDIAFQTIVSQLFVNNESVYKGLKKDLQRTYLAGLDLRKANLYEANLWYANLEGSSLVKANLQKAFFSEAKLHRAWLRGANLQGSDFSEAEFHYTDFSDVEIDKYTNFSGTCLEYYSIEEITRFGNSRKLTRTHEK